MSFVRVSFTWDAASTTPFTRPRPVVSAVTVPLKTQVWTSVLPFSGTNTPPSKNPLVFGPRSPDSKVLPPHPPIGPERQGRRVKKGSRVEDESEGRTPG